MPGEKYVAAVSGGSDSLALLLLLKAHLDRSCPGAKLIAATVDHGLRPASAMEAEDVGRLCRDIGLEHVVLRWTGEKPIRGIQAAARLARHRLLGEFAASIGALAVFTGHTRDDLAETALMRGARGEGRGSAGIAPATLFGGSAWFLRPLLGVKRDQLRNYLVAQGVGWTVDPSNSDARFERARLRTALGQAKDGEAQMDRAVSAAADAAAIRMARAHWAAGIVRLHALYAAPGLIRLDRDALEASDETAIAALGALVAVAGGAEQLPDRKRIGALLHRLRAGTLRANLARALIDARKDAIFFLREARGLPQDAPTPDTIWDGRYAIVAAEEGGRVDSSRPAPAPDSLIRAARRAEPILPPDRAKIPVVAPWRQFLPVFDLVLANEVGRLIGASRLPSLPFQGHIEKTT
ncbi:MAG: tRNA lysidine(34) synthetase TilS [Rhizobiaceae bacterium]|nr:tRNA lysidine(34) synthetase TilS [Rhizobiaceae bacterium]